MTRQAMALLAILSSVFLAAQNDQRGADKALQLDSARPFRMPVRFPDGQAVQLFVMRLASETRTQVGFERVADAPLPDRVTPNMRDVGSALVSGRTVGDALTQILSAAPRLRGHEEDDSYRFAWTAGPVLVHVSPLGARRGFLDKAVAEFELKNETAESAVRKIHRLFDADYPIDLQKVGASVGFRRPSDRSGSEVAAYQRPLTLKLTNTTVRQVLDAIAEGAGDLSWSVVYRDASLGYDGCVVGLHAASGEAVLLGPRPKR